MISGSVAAAASSMKRSSTAFVRFIAETPADDNVEKITFAEARSSSIALPVESKNSRFDVS